MDVILRRRRYTLAATEDAVVLFDADAGPEPTAHFPTTDEGLNAAEERFWQLVRWDRRARWRLPRILWVAVLVGVGLWGLGGISMAVGSVLFLFDSLDADRDRVLHVVSSAFQIIDTVGYRLALGGLILMGAYSLLRWARPTDPKPVDQGEDRGTGTPPGWEHVLRWVMLVTIGLWAAAGAITSSLWHRNDIRISAFTEEPFELSPVFVAGAIIETVSFRLWVGAAVILGIAWLSRFGRAAHAPNWKDEGPADDRLG